MISDVRIIIITLFCLFFAVSPAQAAIDEQGAAKLKSMFEGVLEGSKADLDKGKAGLKMDGDIMVEPSGSYYAVTLPYLTSVTPDGSRTEIGIIAINAIPADAPGQWKMTLAVPSPIVHYGPKGEELVSIKIGRQHFSGIWHEKLDNFVNLKAGYQDVAIRARMDKGFDAVVPDMTVVSDLADSGNGLLSGPTNFSLTGMHVKLLDGGEARIGKVEAVTDIFGYSIDRAAAYRESLRALGESYEAGEASASAPHAKALYKLVTDFVSGAWDGFKMDTKVTDVDMTRPPIPGSPEGKFKLAQGAFGIGMRGFRDNSVTLHVNFGYGGLSLTPPPADFDKTAPTRATVNISVTGVPFAEIANAGQASLESAAQAPALARMAAIQALMTMPQILSQAGTQIVLKDTMAANDHYGILANGTVTADIRAVNGATGKGRIEMEGLETLADLMNEKLQDAKLSPEEKEKLQKTVSMLAVMQMIGKQGKNAEGKPVRTYDFEMNAQGQTLLNGADINALLPKDGEGAKK